MLFVNVNIKYATQNYSYTASIYQTEIHKYRYTVTFPTTYNTIHVASNTVSKNHMTNIMITWIGQLLNR